MPYKLAKLVGTNKEKKKKSQESKSQELNQCQESRVMSQRANNSTSVKKKKDKSQRAKK